MGSLDLGPRLGYVHDNTTIWRFWDQQRRRVIEASNVQFDELARTDEPGSLESDPFQIDTVGAPGAADDGAREAADDGVPSTADTGAPRVAEDGTQQAADVIPRASDVVPRVSDVIPRVSDVILRVIGCCNESIGCRRAYGGRRANREIRSSEKAASQCPPDLGGGIIGCCRSGELSGGY